MLGAGCSAIEGRDVFRIAEVIGGQVRGRGDALQPRFLMQDVLEVVLVGAEATLFVVVHSADSADRLGVRRRLAIAFPLR